MNIKNDIHKYILISIFIIVMFLISAYKLDIISIDETSFWHSIGLFLMAFFTKKEGSIFQFGSFGGVSMNGQSDFLRNTNTVLLEKKFETEQKASKKYNINNDNTLSFFFVILGILFLLISIISTYLIHYAK